MKRLLAIAFALFAVSTAQAQQKTTSAIKADITSLFPSSGVGLITAIQLRAITNEIADSYANKAGDTFNGNLNVATGFSYQINGTGGLGFTGNHWLLGSSGANNIQRVDATDTGGPADIFTGLAKFSVETGPNWNAISGSVIQDGTNGASQPSGVMGYGAVRSAHLPAFGLFGRADCYTTGTCTNEVNSFNYSGTLGAGTYPPDRSTTTNQIVPVALTVASGGNYPSLIGVQIVKEGGSPQQFYTGLYTNPDGVFSNGIFIDANSTQSPIISGLFKNTAGSSANRNLFLQMTGSPASGAKLIDSADSSGNRVFAIDPDGTATFNNQTNGRSLTVGVTDGFNGVYNASGGGDHLFNVSGGTKMDVGLNRVAMNTALQLSKVAVASLPTCNAGAEGYLYSVTDANSATFNAAVAGGGTNHVMAYCNGTGWTVH